MDALMSMKLFLGPNVYPKDIYSYNYGELGCAAKGLGVPSSTSIPHIPQTNGIAENCCPQGEIRHQLHVASIRLIHPLVVGGSAMLLFLKECE